MDPCYYAEYAISGTSYNELYGYSGSYTYDIESNEGCITTDNWIVIPTPPLNQDCLSNIIFSDNPVDAAIRASRFS